jgi:phosphate transport system substrate-binding protein
MLINKIKKSIILIISSLLTTAFLFGCSRDDASHNLESKKIKSEVSISSPISIIPLGNKLLEKYSSTSEEYIFTTKISESFGALQELTTGSATSAFSDIFINEAISPELIRGFIDTKFCVQGIAIVANSNIPITNLTNQQVIDIFAGRNITWKKISGDESLIVVVTNPQDFGMKAIFKKYALNGFKEIEKKTTLANSPAEAIKIVSQTPGSITYVPLNFVQNENNVKKLSFDDIEPTVENIKSGKYPLWSYGHFYSKPNPSEQTIKLSEFLKSDEAKQYIKEMGYIPLDEMQVTR